MLMFTATQGLYSQIKPILFYTENDGLAGNVVREILLDKKGILWVATDNGISRFDGSEFDNLYTTNGLPSNRVGALALGEQGEIYAGCSNGGLVEIRNNIITNLIQTKGKFKMVFRKLYYSKHFHTLFIGTENGFYILHNKKLMPVYYNKDKTDRSIILSITENKSEIFFSVLKGITQGLYHLKFNSENPEKSYAVRISMEGRFASASMDGHLFSSEYSKLYMYRNQYEKPLTVYLDTAFFIWELSPYKNGLLWIGGLGDGRFRSDILLYDIKSNNLIPSHLPQNIQSVNTIFYDSISDVTWFGRDNGLMAFKESPFEYIDFQGKENVLDAANAGDSLLILTENRILYSCDGKIEQVLTKDKVKAKIKKASENTSISVFDTSSGFEFSNFIKDRNKLYVQTGKGAVSLADMKTYLPFGIGSFMVMKDGSVYVALKYQAILHYNSIRNLESRSFVEDTLALNYDNIKILESNGVLYFESRINGLFTAFGDKGLRLNEANSPLDNNLRDMDKDPSGYIWCLSESNKLFQIGYANKPYVRKEIDLLKIGLKGNNCKWIKFAADKLYLASNEGLNIITLEKLYSNSPAIDCFYNEFNGYKFISATSPVLDNQGNIILHTGNEVVKINPIVSLQTKLEINIVKLRINEKDVDVNDLLSKQLSYSTQQISFVFRGIKYPSAKNLRYRYKINEEGWIKGNIVNLQSLRSGKYSILLELFNIENNQIISKEIHFSIAPPFWLSYWFLVLIILVISVLSYVIFRLRYNTLRKRQEEKTKLLVQNSELQLRSLQIQMNPHFIFNALTSIQFLVLSKNIKDTLLYMSNLASIIRSNMEIASKDYIFVSDEIKFLEKYIHIELLRFKNELEITLQNNCETSNILMPPMLVQPLIENAIKHGVRQGKHTGKIRIVFSNSDTELQILVDDNGIGREASRKIQNTNRTHFGLNVIEKRMQLLNEIGKTGINKLEINDKYENDISVGTEVIIHLALISFD